MAKENDSSKLDVLQGALLDDKDFLKQVVTDLLSETSGRGDGSVPADRELPENRERTRLPQRIQIWRSKLLAKLSTIS